MKMTQRNTFEVENTHSTIQVPSVTLFGGYTGISRRYNISMISGILIEIRGELR